MKYTPLMTDGHEHPVSLIWTEETNWVEQLLYHTTADLDHAHLPAKLNLSSKNFAFDDTKQLLKDFQWKGKQRSNNSLYKMHILGHVPINQCQ